MGHRPNPYKQFAFPRRPFRLSGRRFLPLGEANDIQRLHRLERKKRGAARGPETLRRLVLHAAPLMILVSRFLSLCNRRNLWIVNPINYETTVTLDDSS
jgi:hypothetical protein